MDGHALNEMIEYNVRWNEEKCIKLIQKFRSKSILWDTKNPLFYRQPEKKKVWDSIGREMNTAGADCKHKMSVLLSSFRREKAKLKNSIITGIPYSTSWFAFSHLAFLMYKQSETNVSDNADCDADIANEQSESSTTNAEVTYYVTEDEPNHIMKSEPLLDEDEELEKDLGIDHIQTDSPVPAREDTDPQTLQNMILGSSRQYIRRQKIQRKNINPVDSNKLEEIATFTKFIEAKMQKYSPEILNTVQKQICEVLFAADQNHYEHSTSDDTPNATKKRKVLETKNYQNP